MVEATGIEEAFGVFEAYEYGGDRSLVSLGKMLREVLQKVDLVGDDDVRLDLCSDDRVLAYPISWG